MKILYLALIIVVVLGFSCIKAPASGQVTSESAQVVHYQFSQMMSSGKKVYVLYQHNDPFHVYFRKSSDEGKSFGNAIDLGSSNSPVITISGNNIYMAWDTGFGGWPPAHVMFAKSTDGGETFSKPVLLANESNSSSIVTQLVADGSRVYALIYDLGEKPPYQSDVYLMSSQDNGTTWGNKVELLPAPVFTNPLGDDFAIQKVGNQVYIAGGNNIFRKSTDYGLTFGRSTDVIRAANPNDLQLIASSNNVYLVYTAQSYYGQAVFLAKSNDGGSTFSLPKMFSQKVGDSISPHIVADGKNLYAVWKFDNSRVMRNGNGTNILTPYINGIFFAKSNDGGSTISKPVNLSGDVGTSYFSGISTSNGNVYVSWTSKHGNNVQSFFARSADNGTTFSAPVDLTGRYDAWFDQIASSGNDVYVAGQTSYPGDIVWFKASNDAGANFGPLINLNNGTIVSATFTIIPRISTCCIADNPWFQNGWMFTGIAVSAVIGSWFFIFRRLKER
ncbi:MAG: exo-alpha-sialidase [Thaumarchaeota archaeon]|nr:exo-alpha-sialidase [Nitrososphaerota archaeon]